MRRVMGDGKLWWVVKAKYGRRGGRWYGNVARVWRSSARSRVWDDYEAGRLRRISGGGYGIRKSRTRQRRIAHCKRDEMVVRSYPDGEVERQPNTSEIGGGERQTLLGEEVFGCGARFVVSNRTMELGFGAWGAWVADSHSHRIDRRGSGGRSRSDGAKRDETRRRDATRWWPRAELT